MNIKKIIKLAYYCILEEANTWPCLGLVSKKNSGSHDDMNINTFKKSAKIFKQYLTNISKNYPKIKNLNDLRKWGIIAEKTMFKATKNINTHKGLVFALGIVFFNFLKIYFKKIPFSKLTKEIKKFTLPLKNDFLNDKNVTSGITLFKTFKINGARQTALSGYTIIFKAITEITSILKKQPNLKQNEINFLLLLYFYLHIEDTTVINKVGYENYLTSKNRIKTLYSKIKVNYNKHIDDINIVNNWAITNNISPGGCGDLIVITLFLMRIKPLI